MKKLVFINFIFFVLFGLIFSQSIIITSPHAGDTWYKGHAYNITWNSSGIPASTNMKINIFKNSINTANFIEQITTINDGSENWLIGTGYVTGTFYIRIKTSDNAVHGDSDGFSVKKKFTLLPVNNLKRQHIPLCTIKEVNSIFTTSDKVTFRVKYSFSPTASISIVDRPARYRLVAYIPNSKSAGRLYFSCTTSPFQGIPIGQEKTYIIDVIYSSDLNQPPIFKSGTAEFVIFSIYNSENPVCSKKIDFYHEWHH